MNVDGDTGEWAVDGPDSRVDYITGLSLTARTTTYRGRQLMRPGYGINLRQVVDRGSYPGGAVATIDEVRKSVAGLKVDVRVKVDPDTGDLDISVRP